MRGTCSLHKFFLIITFGLVLFSVCQEVVADKAEGAIVAVVGSRNVTEVELGAEIGHALSPLLVQAYEMKLRALEKLIDRRLLQAEAENRSLSVDDLLEAEENAANPVTAKEVRTVYDRVKWRVSGLTEEQALSDIEKKLRLKHRGQARAGLLTRLRFNSGVRILLEPPRLAPIPVVHSATLGAEEAPVTVVEFSDFQCPYCPGVAAGVKRLESEYRGRVRIAFRHLPLPSHRQAEGAAEACECAQEQNAFWEMHDLLFANQNALEESDLCNYAERIGLDMDAFLKCLQSGQHRDRVKRDVEEARSYGVRGAPTLFVNGRLLIGRQGYERLRSVVEAELALLSQEQECRQGAKN